MTTVRIGRRHAVASAAGAAFFVCAGGAIACLPLTATPKIQPATGSEQATLNGAAAGCHATFDRFVIRAALATPRPAYDVRYVTSLVGPSGAPVAVLGNRRLRVRVTPAKGHAGGASLLPTLLTPLCSSLRQVKAVEDFEGVVVLGLGIAGGAAKPFCVFRLAGPARIVVDVAH
jgi:hypothetical protein